jgi:hypothetical protein
MKRHFPLTGQGRNAATGTVKNLTKLELLALDQGALPFRYLAVGASEWRTAFYDPQRHPDPRVWLERNGIAVAETDLAPQCRPPDVSTEAWALVQLMRQGRTWRELLRQL